MNTTKIQIVQLYKQGATAPEVAEALGLPLEVVETLLAADKEINKELEQTKEIAELSSKMDNGLASMQDLAISTMKSLLEDDAVKPSTRATLSMYVADHALGLKKPRNISVVFNINEINEKMQKVRARREAMENAINVNAEKVPA